MPAFVQSLFANPLFLIFFLLLVALYIIWFFYRKSQGTGGEKSGGGTAYTKDLTAEAKAGNIEPVVGREQEIERTIHILSRKTKNNPILLGEPGVGKTAIVEGLVLRIAAGDVPENLKGKRVLALDLPGMISGTKYRGEFEDRVKTLLESVLAAKRAIILFIDEVHMIVQAKGSEGALNVSDILKPALARGDLQAIGATTKREYEEYIRPDDALDRRFQPVVVNEPDPGAALQIIRGIKSAYEAHHRVLFSDDALHAAVNLSAKYIKGRFLPDKAIDLIDEAGASVGIEASHEAWHASGILHAAAGKKRAMAEEARHRKEEILVELEHVKKLESKMKDEQEVADLRRRMEHLAHELEVIETTQREDIPTVTADDIKKIVSDWAQIPIKRLV